MRQYRHAPEDVFDYAAYRSEAIDERIYASALYDGARSILDSALFPDPRAERETTLAELERLLGLEVESAEEASSFQGSLLPKRIVLTGSQAYARAFGSYLASAG